MAQRSDLPVRVGGHRHMYELTWSTQVDPLAHLLFIQSSTLVSQCIPWNPEIIQHRTQSLTQHIDVNTCIQSTNSVSQPTPHIPTHLNSVSQPTPHIPTHLNSVSQPTPPIPTHLNSVSQPTPHIPTHLNSVSQPTPPIPTHLNSVKLILPG
jgi:hypothetical protein